MACFMTGAKRPFCRLRQETERQTARFEVKAGIGECHSPPKRLAGKACNGNQSSFTELFENPFE